MGARRLLADGLGAKASRLARVQRLETRCDTCRAPVRMRTAQKAFAAFRAALERGELHPNDVVFTTMCARRLPDNRLCNTLIEVRAKHIRPVSHG